MAVGAAPSSKGANPRKGKSIASAVLTTAATSKVAKSSAASVLYQRDADLFATAKRLILQKADTLRTAAQEDRITKLVEALIVGEPRSAIMAEIEADNAALRARYLSTIASYSAADLHRLAGSRAANKSALAGGWKDNGRVFAVPFQGVDRFPAFQFSDGQPRAVIKTVLAALPAQMSPWQIALWFASNNGWMDGRAPQDSLDQTEALTYAAAQLGAGAIG